MTMKITIEHSSGSSYAAVVKADGALDVILKEGQKTEVWMHSTKSVTVTEIAVPVETSPEA